MNSVSQRLNEIQLAERLSLRARDVFCSKCFYQECNCLVSRQSFYYLLELVTKQARLLTCSPHGHTAYNFIHHRQLSMSLSGRKYVQALWTHLPASIQQDIASGEQSCPNLRSSIEGLIRLVLGQEPQEDAEENIKAEWALSQERVMTALDQLGHGRSLKRGREEEESAPMDVDHATKKPRTTSTPLFVLHNVSTTSPVRKKVDLIVYPDSIALVHPTSGVEEAYLPVSSLRRAFVLPTKGKTKAHWTVVVLSGDVGEKTKPAAGTDSANQNQQLIFGLDAVAAAVVMTSIFTPNEGKQSTSHPKGTPTLPLIRQFLGTFPVKIYEPTPDVFKSALHQSGTNSAVEGGVPGVDAHKSAKSGTLWFMKEGILWGESKPCEFWALEDLRAVRVLGAASGGRMCSLSLTRRATGENEQDEETQFTMVDGKEMDGMNEWVRTYQKSFGPAVSTSKGVEQTQQETPPPPPVQSGPATIRTMLLDDEDDDEDFVGDSDVDGSERSSDEDAESNEDSDDEDDAKEEGADEEEDDGEVEEIDDQGNHPLRQPGAVPKMSRAAMDIAVAMVTDDIMGEEVDELED